MIQKLLSNTQMIWMIFKKILKNRIQIKNAKKTVFEYMIADLLSNKKLNL